MLTVVMCRPQTGPSPDISITVMGEVPKGQALTRSGAQVGDDVSGHLGWARLGLAQLNGEIR